MPLDNVAKEAGLDAIAALVDEVSIHTADPGSGADNEVSGGGYSRQSASFAAADGNSMALASTLEFDGPNNEDATWFAIWGSGPTRLGKGQISGDTAFNAEGRFDLTTGTTVTLTDPS